MKPDKKDYPKTSAEAEKQIAKCAKEKGSELDLSGLGLRRLPESMKGLRHVETLALRNNKITELPEWLGEFRSLRELILDDNGPLHLPGYLAKLPALALLRVGGDPGITGWEVLSRIRSLRSLWVYDAGWSALPVWVRSLPSLETLVVDGNELSDLPEWIGELTQLRFLSFGRNQLSHLPSSFAKLTQLNNLYLERNRLSTIPPILHELPALERLYLPGNPSLQLPAELVEGKDAPAILAYARKLTEGAGRRALNEAKLILVGRGGAGKTSVRKRLLDGEFDLAEDKTTGNQVKPWLLALGQERVKLNVWDFGGQEIMHATHQFFLTKRSLYVLVLNAREGEQDANVEYWLRMMAAYGGGSPALVVINKCDQHPLDLDERGLRAKYPFIRGFVRTDCAKDFGIGELRTAIERETGALPDLRTPFPGEWFSLKEKLEALPDDCIAYDAYLTLCNENDEKDALNQEVLIGFLNDLGSVLHFKDDAKLCDLGVLKPDWVTQGIYGLINAETLKARNGALAVKELGTLLDKGRYPLRRHDFLLSLMEKFELCFEVPHTSRESFLIPELLPKETPALPAWETGDSLGFEYHYNILPEGLLPRFIVRTHTMSEGAARWRHGVELRKGEARALVKADVQERRVTIAVRGPGHTPRELLAVIRREFEEIHAAIKGLEAAEKVPVPGYAKRLDYRALLVREAKGKETVEFETETDSIELPLGKLLDSFEEPESRRERATIIVQAGGRLIMPHEHYDFSGANITNSVVGAHMENITNAIQALPPERVELRKELEALKEHAGPLLQELPKEGAEEMGQNLEDFTKEAAKEKPRKGYLDVTSKGLIEAAGTVAALAGPIIGTVEKLRVMLGF